MEAINKILSKIKIQEDMVIQNFTPNILRNLKKIK